MSFLRWIVGVIIIIWLLGFVLKIGGSLIHLLIVIAVIVFLFDFIGGRRRPQEVVKLIKIYETPKDKEIQ